MNYCLLKNQSKFGSDKQIQHHIQKSNISKKQSFRIKSACEFCDHVSNSYSVN